MGSGTNPDDDRKKDDGAKRDGDGSQPDKAGEGAPDLNQLMFGGVGRDMPPSGGRPLRRPKTVREILDTPQTEEERRQHELEMEPYKDDPIVQALRIDKSKLIPGPPVPEEDIALLYKGYRGQATPEEIERLVEISLMMMRYRNWYEADRDAAIAVMEESRNTN